jgi:PAS domain S-box-containing protein
MKRKVFLILILLISFIAVLFMPFYTNFYLYPAFTQHLISDYEDSAIRLANHLIHYFEEPENTLLNKHITRDVIEEIEEMHADFGCEKIKIFSTDGTVIYSTDFDDIGSVNTRAYFKHIVTQGVIHTKVVRKNSRTLEGRLVPVDVIETYVPLKYGDKTIGAGEVYFDITEHREAIDTLIYKSSTIIYTVTIVLLLAVLLTLYRLNKNMIAREEAEVEIAAHRDKLEEQVNLRTAELKASNILLKEDIEKRQKAEKALRESEEKYRELIETASDAIFVIDAESGKINDVNKKGQELLGRSSEEIIGLHHSRMHPTDETEKYVELFKKIASQITAPDKEFHVLHKDGYLIPVEISTSVIELEGRKIIQGIFRDIRERITFEEEMQKAERLESAGILAGGIAHDFNNILTAILGNISLTKKYVEPGTNVHERLLETEKATIRAKSLTQQLLTFAKGGLPITRTVDLSSTIVESAEFVLKGTNLKCEFNLADDLWPVEADIGQINQVINNLVINASQVMPSGGVCSLEAQNIIIKKSDQIPLEAGRYIKISVHDKGEGILPGHLNKIFDPYFTTKKTGSGLGLSTAYSIIKKHGGLLTVDSEVGKGSTFHIFLKASAKTLLPGSEDELSADLIQGEGRILLMDDEKYVREIAAELLQYLGYTVDTAKDGREALALYKKSMKDGELYKVVIMDLTIPGGMGGKETIQELKKLDPEAKTIVSSGYAKDPILAKFEKYGFDGMVPKPYNVEELSEILHQVIAGTIKSTEKN